MPQAAALAQHQDTRARHHQKNFMATAPKAQAVFSVRFSSRNHAVVVQSPDLARSETEYL